MTDYFAFFGLPRHPRVDEGRLKERYLELAATSHPDATAGDSEKFAELRDAYQTLLDPALRIGHLLALDFPGFQRPANAAQYPDLFMKVGSALQKAKSVTERRGAATSPLAKAVLAGEVKAASAQVDALLAEVRACRLTLENELESTGISPEKLAALASGFSFLRRWEAELAETGFRLANG